MRAADDDFGLRVEAGADVAAVVARLCRDTFEEAAAMGFATSAGKPQESHYIAETVARARSQLTGGRGPLQRQQHRLACTRPRRRPSASQRRRRADRPLPHKLRQRPAPPRRLRTVRRGLPPTRSRLPLRPIPQAPHWLPRRRRRPAPPSRPVLLPRPTRSPSPAGFRCRRPSSRPTRAAGLPRRISRRPPPFPRPTPAPRRSSRSARPTSWRLPLSRTASSRRGSSRGSWPAAARGRGGAPPARPSPSRSCRSHFSWSL